MYRRALELRHNALTVAVVMAGNVPAVGFHDFLSVLFAGHRFLGKLSSEDNKLMPAIAEVLIALEPVFADAIRFTGETIKGFDAVIATGSNNSSRYFEYYFGKYPHIIRKNRNGVAVLTGRENEEKLRKLSEDIFLYFGLGCRNVAFLYVPFDYDFSLLLKVLSERKELTDNNKYFNNYEYNKAIFLVNNTAHFDTGNLILTEQSQYGSPVSVLHYAYYRDAGSLRNELMLNRDKIQCVVADEGVWDGAVPFGKSQVPMLWEYADNTDTVEFLLSLPQ